MKKAFLIRVFQKTNAQMTRKQRLTTLQRAGQKIGFKFDKVHFWSDPYHLCNVPAFYEDCRNPVMASVSNVTSLDANMLLKHTTNRYNCYVWGCSSRITPVRFYLKWQTTILASIALLVAAFDWSKTKQKNQ